jgi:GDP/GTP exchange factor required for growth at low temperature
MSQHLSLKNDNYNNVDNDDNSNNDSLHSNFENEFQDSDLNMKQLLMNFDENEPIFDNELLYPTPKESEIVHFNDDSTLIHGTVEALITYITSPELLNYQFLVDFFLTFRIYIDPLPLLELLLCRLSWCLKKSLSTHKEESTTGKLVLIRTFVTIRHWLLNYFQDDFVSDPILRTLFTNTINELSKYERYIGNDKSNIQSKIIKDLKKNYIILSSLFWDIKIEDDYDIDLLNYKISSYDDFDDSRLSIMGSSQLRDPSVRRSNLLSMFDNPSSSNILNESVKNKIADTLTYDKETPLETFLNKKSKLKLNDEKKKVHNFVLYPKDSLNALATPKMKSYADDNSSIDLLYNTLCKNEPVSGFIPLDKSSITDSFDGGFTIRGNIEVFQDSSVNKISPLVLRNPSSNMKKQNVEKIETQTATTRLKAVPFKESSNILPSKPKKKGFLKSMFNNSNNKENNLTKNYNTQSKSPISFSESYNAVTKQSDTTNSNNKEPNNLIFELEKQIDIDGNNLDYLEDIVIRDYQIMIQHPNFKQRYSKQIRNSNRKSILSMAFNFGGDNESKFDPSDSPIKRSNKAYCQGQLEKSINVNNSHNNNAYVENEKSFQTPPDTLDWSNSLNVDETNDNVFVDMGLSNDEIQDVSVLEGTLNSNNQNCYQQDLNHKRSSLQNIRSNVSRFSHISKKEKYNSDSNILRNNNGSGFINILKSTNNSYFANSEIVFSNRTSFKIVGRSSLRSNKSYLTYDSNFSESTNEAYDKNKYDDDDQGIKLKKKNAILNLRVDNHEENILYQNEQDTKPIVQEKEHVKIMHDQQDSFFIDNNDAISNMIENFDETNSINDENLIEILHVFEELPYFDDIQSMNTLSSGISILPSPTPSQACYNGLSQTDIKELAAIPAEKLEGDPLNYTLSKLRGERKKFKVIVGLNDDKQDDDEIHRKHAVAVVCQSPTKKDSQKNIYNTLNDAYNNNDEDDSNDELKLEQQVRELYISSNPNDVGNKNLSRHNSKLEMNMITRQSLNRTKENSSVLTRVSTGKFLRDDGEKSCFDLQSLSATPRAFDNTKLVLSVEEILEKELHIPFIFRYDSDKLAAQMTLIERDIILEVEWKELINLKWDQPLTPYNSWLKLLLDLSNKTGLELITLRFNLVNNWIISEILLCKNFTLRVLAITRFIELAHKCRQIQNYGTLFQIMLALNSEVMKKLKSTWIRVDPATILKFKELKDLTSPNNNFKNYRDEIVNIVPSKGFIPFLPLALSDLTMYSEMPTIINSDTEILNDLDSLSEFDTSSAVNYDLINFEKFRVIGETVKDTLRHIEWSRFFDFQIDKKIISKCLYISSLSEEDMTLCLKEIEM